jgi:hypothetical protein
MTKVWLLLTMAGVGFAQVCLVEPPAGKPITPIGAPTWFTSAPVVARYANGNGLA